MQKLDLVIQGPVYPYTHSIVRQYRSLEWVNRIIVSSWKHDEDVPLADKNVKSLPLSNNGIGNRNAHIVTSHRGLQEVQTEFCAKLRSDQIISNESMNLMYEYSLKRPDKVCVAGFYKPFPFHPRDHIFWGPTEEVYSVFDIPLDAQEKIEMCEMWPQKGSYASFTRAECYIASQYLSKKDYRVKIMADNPRNFLVDFAPQWGEAKELSEKLMPKYFAPFPKIELEWPKHHLASYNYEGCASFYGEYWGES